MKKLILYPLLVGISMLTSAYVTASDSHSYREIDRKGNLSIQDLVTYQANQHNIPVAFAHAIIQVESDYDPKAKSGSSTGLGQIQCATAREMGLEGSCNKLYDPETNLVYAFKYLRMAIDKAHGNLCHAAVLYNQGLNASATDSGYCRNVMRHMKNQ
jgi:soluble lytic murein transglycosylase-like protein